MGEEVLVRERYCLPSKVSATPGSVEVSLPSGSPARRYAPSASASSTALSKSIRRRSCHAAPPIRRLKSCSTKIFPQTDDAHAFVFAQREQAMIASDDYLSAPGQCAFQNTVVGLILDHL